MISPAFMYCFSIRCSINLPPSKLTTVTIATLSAVSDLYLCISSKPSFTHVINNTTTNVPTVDHASNGVCHKDGAYVPINIIIEIIRK